MYNDITRFSSYGEDIEQAEFWAEVQAEQENEMKHLAQKAGIKW